MKGKEETERHGQAGNAGRIVRCIRDCSLNEKKHKEIDYVSKYDRL